MKRSPLPFLLVPAVLSITSASGTPLQLNSAADLYQQTNSSPCVFGGSNCQNPLGWAMSPTDTGNSGAYAATQTYSGADYTTFLNVATSAFIIGIDVNDTGVAQTLNSFTINFNDGSTYTFAGPASIPSLANGVGWSDYTLSMAAGASIPIPAAATAVTFSVNADLNDGPDRFFIVGQGPITQSEVPEPATFGLFIAGIGGLSLLRRRCRQ
jgi:hypothetical protein